LLDHTLAVCQTLWREQRASYSDEILQFDAIHQMPKPAQEGGVPIWVSGTVNRSVVRRLARFGSGWIPWGPSAADLPAGIAQMREGVAAAGRDPGELRVVGSLPVVRAEAGGVDLARTMDGVPALVDLGVTDFQANLPVPDDNRAAADYLSEAVGAFRAVVGRA
jgi:alkanesulfonate monooxygenase SsuD/methylene tetrahydromethanopterin reductase-like flavin-dependent oxidoreductase (luciferase family)